MILLAISPMLWQIARSCWKNWSQAERRAHALLRDTLTPAQYRQLCWHGYLEIPSATAPDRVYRVPRSRGYVHVVEHGRTTMRLCLQPVENLPDADIVVLHKLMIEANEDDYLETANKYHCLD